MSQLFKIQHRSWKKKWSRHNRIDKKKASPNHPESSDCSRPSTSKHVKFLRNSRHFRCVTHETLQLALKIRFRLIPHNASIVHLGFFRQSFAGGNDTPFSFSNGSGVDYCEDVQEDAAAKDLEDKKTSLFSTSIDAVVSSSDSRAWRANTARSCIVMTRALTDSGSEREIQHLCDHMCSKMESYVSNSNRHEWQAGDSKERDVVCVPLVSSSLGVVWCLDDIMAVSTLTALPDNSAQVKTQLTLPRPSVPSTSHGATIASRRYHDN